MAHRRGHFCEASCAQRRGPSLHERHISRDVSALESPVQPLQGPQGVKFMSLSLAKPRLYWNACRKTALAPAFKAVLGSGPTAEATGWGSRRPCPAFPPFPAVHVSGPRLGRPAWIKGSGHVGARGSARGHAGGTQLPSGEQTAENQGSRGEGPRAPTTAPTWTPARVVTPPPRHGDCCGSPCGSLEIPVSGDSNSEKVRGVPC